MRMLLLLCLFLGACSTQQPDYPRFRAHQPKSIVVLPPLNSSNTLRAPELYLATAAKPLAEAGYYVFPPLAVLKYFQEQGVPSGVEAKEVSPKRLREVFGADAALYATIEEWGERYQIISSQNIARIHLSLIDLKSELEIWAADAQAVDTPQNSNGVIGAVVGSLIHGLLNTSASQEYLLSQRALQDAMLDANSGLLVGAKRPNFAEDRRGIDP